MRSVKVADYMARRLVTFHPETALYQAMCAMVENRISGAPVVDDQRHLVGVLSEADFLRAMVLNSYHGEIQGTVGEFMTADPQTIDADTDIYTASEIFLRDKRRRLPVVHEGKLVGQLSRRDVLRAAKELIGGG